MKNNILFFRLKIKITHAFNVMLQAVGLKSQSNVCTDEVQDVVGERVVSLGALNSLETSINQCINDDRFGDALLNLTNFCGGIIADSAAIGRIYSSLHLDGICKTIGSQFRMKKGLTPKSLNCGTVIVVTQLVETGGHVEVIKDLLRLNVLEEPVTIVITNYLIKTEDRICEEYRTKFGVKIISVGGEDLNGMFEEINECLLNLSPKKLILVSYNHDSMAIAAALSGAFKEVVFIHHGDHHLCLGAATKEFTHIDLHNCAFHICRNYLGMANKYWPLTVNTEILPKNINDFNIDNEIRTCTSGRGEKFESIGYMYDYFEFIPKIISATKGRHFHIGHLSESKLEMIFKLLEKAGLPQTSFVHIPRTPSLATLLIELKIDLYISSFPLGGGKASLEVMAAGIPIVMHINYLSRSHGGFDLIYQDAFFWETEEQFETILTNLSSNELLLHSKRSAEHFNKYYKKENLLKAVLDVDKEQDLSLVPPVRQYFPDPIYSYITYWDKRG